MLFQPEEHETLTDESWDAGRVRAGIRTIAADIEAAYDDGWPSHPRDGESDRRRTVYLGGAGVVEALRRLRASGLVDVPRDYVAYLERSIAAGPEFPGPGVERSLWMGEVGIRLVLQRLAPSAENLERLAELIADNARDERRELMWGSAGTILAGRELGLDVSESVRLASSATRRGRPLDVQGPVRAAPALSRPGARLHRLCPRPRRCRRGLGDTAPLRVRRSRPRELACCRGPGGRTFRSSDPDAVVPRRARDRVHPRADPRRGPCARRREPHVAGRAAPQGCKPLPRHCGQRLRIPRVVRTQRRRRMARSSTRVRDPCARPGRAGANRARARPVHPLDGRRRHRPLSRRLPRRCEPVAAPAGRSCGRGPSCSGACSRAAAQGRKSNLRVFTTFPAALRATTSVGRWPLAKFFGFTW